MTAQTLVEKALELVAIGLAVFPLGPTRLPLAGSHGFHDASTDEAVVRQAFAAPGAANIGVATGEVSGIDVLDLDPRNGSDEWLDVARLPVTRTYATRSGGRHYVFRHAPGLRCSVGRVAPGVDVKADGGYATYHPANGLPVLVEGPIAEWPDWLLSLAVMPVRAAATSASGEPSPLEPPPSAEIVIRLLQHLPNDETVSRGDYVNINLAVAGCCQSLDDADGIAEAIAGWSARWPGSLGFDAELDKFENDFLQRDRPLAGWPQLLRHARRMAPDLAYQIGHEIAVAEFATRPLPELTITAATFTAGNHEFPLTQDGVALAFARQYRDELRYCHILGAWFRCEDGIWRREVTQLAFEWGRRLSRELGARPETPKAIRDRFARVDHAKAVETFARSDRDLVVKADEFDRDDFLMGTPGGTIDLRTGELMTSRPEDYISRSAAVAPSARADCPTWLRFLAEATAGDAALIRLLQQWCGYCLTGSTREHALMFIYGPGGNGKSVFLTTLSKILGSYAVTAPIDMLTPGKGERHPTEIAMLHGARLVSASETNEGSAWDEARIKVLTGGDPITGRFMRQDFFTFDPRFKLVVVGNHKPSLRNPDAAARRRFNIVPFIHLPATPDRMLESKLRAEWPGILRWMVDGCLDWQRNGLVRPMVVEDATAEYFSEQDHVARWIEECCEIGDKNLSATSEALFTSWTAYALRVGERPQSARWLASSLGRLGCVPAKHVGGRDKRGFRGIAIRAAASGDLSLADMLR